MSVPMQMPEKLKPYTFHKVNLVVQGDEGVGDCPWCGREGKFSVNVSTGLYRCVVCNTGSAKGGGNIYTFLKHLHTVGMTQTTDDDYKQLAGQRNLLYTSTLKEWKVCKSPIDGTWLVPGYSTEGKLTQLYRYVKLQGHWKLLATATLPHALHGPDLETPVGGDQITKTPKTGPVYRCEGPWDGMALWEVGRRAKKEQNGSLSATSNASISLLGNGASVIAVPGCGTFPEHWSKVLAGRMDYSFYDNDHPREHPPGSGRVTQAGLDGTKRTIEVLSRCETPPSASYYLRWGNNGTYHDETLPDGYDLRDCLASGGDSIIRRVSQLEKIMSRLTPVPNEWIPGRNTGPAAEGTGGVYEMDLLPCSDWKVVQAAAEKALKWTEGLDRALCVMLASITSVKSVGDQLWCKIVGPASCGKSVLCEAVSTNTKYVIAKSTMRGFHSGFQTDADGKEDHSLVSKVRNKTLVTKDGDTLLQSPNLSQILSEARDVYDRVSRTSYRNQQSREYKNLDMTWILCGTSSLRALDSSELGERFVDSVVVDQIDEDEERLVALRVARRACKDVTITSSDTTHGQDGPEMTDFKRLVGGYISYLRENAQRLLNEVSDSEEALEQCVDLGTFVAYMRSRPSVKQDEKVEREMAYRLTSQMVRLAKCLAAVQGKKSMDEDVMRYVRLVALDTARGKTMDLCQHIRKMGELGAVPDGLAILTGESSVKINDLLKFLKKIRAIRLDYVGSGSRVAPRWFLTKRLSTLFHKVVGPVDEE